MGKKKRVDPPRRLKGTHPNISSLVHDALARTSTTGNTDENKFFHEYRFVESSEVAAIQQQTGLALPLDLAHGIDESHIRHALKRHGHSNHPGEIPITLQDFERIPDITKNYTSVAPGESENGLPVLVYLKEENDRTYVVVEWLKQRRKLNFDTMYINKKSS